MALPEDQWLEFIDEVDILRQDCGVPGAAVAVITDRTQVRTYGCGVRDMRSGQPVTDQTLFHIASTQKPMTSLFVASLVDQGVLDWDTPVAETVPQFKLSDDAATRSVTMRHLLSMSSGIPASGEDDLGSSLTSPETLFERAAYLNLNGRPGERFDYSNVSYALAGYSAALAAGCPWGQLEAGYGQLMADRLFVPAGMRTATFSLNEARATANCCSPHELYDGSIEPLQEEGEACDPLAPAGGARVNIVEMARYLMLELNGGQAGGRQVVSRENLEARWQPQIVDQDSGTSYGLGWGVTDQRGKVVLVHEGSFGGFMSALSLCPEDGIGLALLGNLDGEEYFIQDVCDLWLDMMLPKKGGILGWFS